MSSERLDTNVVCYWGLALADDRALPQQEKDMGLSLLAKSGNAVFSEEGPLDVMPSLTFSPNDLAAHPALWCKTLIQDIHVCEVTAVTLWHIHVIVSGPVPIPSVIQDMSMVPSSGTNHKCLLGTPTTISWAWKQALNLQAPLYLNSLGSRLGI